MWRGTKKRQSWRRRSNNLNLEFAGKAHVDRSVIQLHCVPSRLKRLTHRASAITLCLVCFYLMFGMRLYCRNEFQKDYENKNHIKVHVVHAFDIKQIWILDLIIV